MPQAQAGGEQLPPGEWAKYVKELPWRVARVNKYLKTPSIELLSTAPPRQEPIQRSFTGYTGKRLDERVSSSVPNAESILIQVVGTISDQEYSSCLKGNGPWAHCVRFPDITDTVTACGNCQWNSQKSRCDFYQAPPGGRATLGHRRNRSSASSGGSPQVNLVVESERVMAYKAALQEIQEAVRSLQARQNIDLTS